MQRLRAAHGGARVSLIGHSAGGWLARAFLTGGDTDGWPYPGVEAVVTLGSPNFPPPASNDPTRGALAWLHRSAPGAAFARHGVRYVSVAGRAIAGSTAPLERANGSQAATSARSYAALLLDADGGHNVVGDGVVPAQCALLPGSAAVVLPGVWHSMSRRAGSESGPPWYGSDEVVDHWLAPLIAGVGG